MTIEREQEKGNSIGLETLDSRVHAVIPNCLTLCRENDGRRGPKPSHDGTLFSGVWKKTEAAMTLLGPRLAVHPGLVLGAYLQTRRFRFRQT